MAFRAFVFQLMALGLSEAQQVPSKEFVRDRGKLIAIEVPVSGTAFDSEVVSLEQAPVIAGQTFVRAIGVRNTGSQNWVSASSDPINGVQLKYSGAATPNPWGTSEYALPSSPVLPNGTVTFSVSGTAPTLPGLYDYSWRTSQVGPTGFFGATASGANGKLEVRTSGPAVLGFAPLTYPPPAATPASEATFTGRFSGGSSPVKRIGIRFLTHAEPHNVCTIELDAIANIVKLYKGYNYEELQTASLGSTGTLTNSFCEVRMSQTTAVVQGNTLVPGVRIGFNSEMTGPHNVYAMVENTNNERTGYDSVFPYIGAWEVPAPSGSVTISSGGSGNLAPYATRTFSASVSGLPGGAPTTVRWSVLSLPAGQPAGRAGTIFTDNGLECSNGMTYRAPSTIASGGNITIRAESCHNAALKANYSIPVVAGTSVTVSIAPQPTHVGGAASFTATVSNADVGGVNWTLSTTPAGSAAISPTNSLTTTFTPNPNANGSAILTATSVENSSVSAPHPFTFSAPPPSTQSITVNSFVTNGRAATLDLSVLDHTASGQAASRERIQWLDLVLSPDANANTLPPGSACRIRVSKTANSSNGFRVQVDDQNGGGNYVPHTPVENLGQMEQLGSNNSCRVSLAQSSGSTASDRWNLTLRITGGGMSGMRYLRGATTAIAPSVSAAWGQLAVGGSAASWNVPASRISTLTNSRSTYPQLPTVPAGETVQLFMQVAGGLYPGEIARIQLEQSLDGSYAIETPSGGNVAQGTYTAYNGPTRRVRFRPLIYTNGNLNELAETNPPVYEVIIGSSADFPPSLEYKLPGTQTDAINPYPKDVTLTANGSTSYTLEYGVKNDNYSALTGAYRIQEFNFNINRTFSESGFTQDASGGCRLQTITGSSTHTFLLANDQGQYTLPAISYNPSTGTGGSASNSQCTVEIIGPASYLYSPTYYNSYLFFGIRFTFKPAFSGSRYVFMKSNRIQGEGTTPTTGWKSAGTYVMQ